jgi:hypothetical protein
MQIVLFTSSMCLALYLDEHEGDITSAFVGLTTQSIL